MNIMELGALGEFVGAIAVVVTLIYLAVQLRQTTKTVRVSMIQAAERGVSDIVAAWSRDAETAALMRKGREAFNELDDDQKALVALLVRRLLLHMDSMHWASKERVLPTEIWEREDFALRMWLGSDAGRAAWEVGGWTESFRDYVEREIMKTR